MLVPLEELAAFAHTFVFTLPKVAGPRAHIVGLSGDLGAGKTTFVQHVARELGVTDPVTSPTYVIAERYDIAHPPFTSLVHIDAYRLESKEVSTIGWEDFIKNPENLVLVEWPENIGDAFPSDAERLSFSVVSESSRDIAHAS
jgi:tRNA threonylcarbamoyladenosine biosynthesis protein TsaE